MKQTSKQRKKKMVQLSAILVVVAIITAVAVLAVENKTNSDAIAVPASESGTNSGLVQTGLIQEGQYTTESTISPKILIYADDAYHLAPNTYIDQALKTMGLSYTAFYNGNFAGFNTALTTAGPWDLVIFGGENNLLPDATTLNNLNNYVNGGGKLIARSWQLGSFAANPLWSTMGVTYISNDITTADPVYWWNPSHPILQNVDQLTVFGPNLYSIYGQYVQPLPSATALAGYTKISTANKAAIILRNDKRTLFFGFMDGQNDLAPVGTELWKNSIDYLLKKYEYVFVRGADNALWYKRTDGFTWSSWVSLGGVLASDPDGSEYDGNIYVYARGSDNALWYRKFDGQAWSGWTSLGGILTGTPGTS